jgi:23S rRNA (guanine745-N1)-methyltransferase
MRLLCTVRTCHAPLEREAQTYVCPNGHSFDVARSGYVNLLQPQDRRSRVPGDTQQAVAARRRFFDAGHTEPLVAAIVDAFPLAAGDPLLDVGCGEGHHLAAFRRAWSVDGHGVDISVAAIDLAARRYRDCTWIVANADRFIPYEDGSFRAVTSITSRLEPDEFHRVLSPHGILLIVIPGADDLVELRAGERDRVERTIEMFAPHFTLARREHVRHVARLDPTSIADLMLSTYRVSRETSAMDVTLSRDVLVFARNAP